mgnify:CR=1 FL=1
MMETLEQVTMTKSNAFKVYEDSMNEADKVAYKIAIQQLESSFDLEKSIGFLEYIKKQNIILVD